MSEKPAAGQFAAQLGCQTLTPVGVIGMLPTLHYQARASALDAEDADPILQETLELALTLVDAAPADERIGRWLAVLLEAKAAEHRSARLKKPKSKRRLSSSDTD